MSKNEPSTDLDYVDRADAASREALAAEIPLIIKAFETATTGGQQISKGAIITANAVREIGIRLKACSGHEKLSFLFWKTRLEKLLPFDFDFARFAISLSNQMDRKAAKIADAYPMMQLMLIGMGIIEAPHREGKQNAIANKLQAFCCKMIEFKKPFQQILNNNPMEQWPIDDLELFIAESNWILKERDRAETILKRKAKA